MHRSRAIAVLVFIALASSAGCHASPVAKSDAGTPPDASTSPSAPAQSTTLATPVADASSDASAPVVHTDGTIGLLVEHVLVDPGEQPASSHGFDLLVLTTLPGKKPKRSQPSCPPLKRDMYEMCRHFRACNVADAGAAVVCDGASFELVQHDGGTFLRGEDKELPVSTDLPTIAPPTARERHAYVDL